MRIISGKFKGLILKSGSSEITRPTVDRAKEGLFSAIQFEIENSVVADLFSGSGSLGIECLSRDAKFVYFFDKNYEPINFININLKKLPNITNYLVSQLDYLKSLEYLFRLNIKLDILFLDPPYKINCFSDIFNFLDVSNVMQEEGLIIIETSTSQDLSFLNKYPNLKIKKYKYGNVLFLICKKFISK